MSIGISKYLSEGKTTFQIERMEGGVYGCNIAYTYGVFHGNESRGMQYKNHTYTEYDSSSDDRDGIGSMETIRKRSLWWGTFIDGKKNGFCFEFKNGKKENVGSFGIYENDICLSTDEFMQKSQRTLSLATGEKVYLRGKNALIYKGGVLVYMGGVNANCEPCGFGVKYGANANVAEYGRFAKGEKADYKFTFEEGETMPVDSIDEDGFNVLREMDFSNDGDVECTVTEGMFVKGKLNGFGLMQYKSSSNGYSVRVTKAGLFKDGKLFFGYNGAYRNRGGSEGEFGYAEAKPKQEEKLIYNGQEYVGEAKDGIPNGIGRLYETGEKMLHGTFKAGKLHGIGATYRKLDGEWIPYDYESDYKDPKYVNRSWGIFVEGQQMPDMTWEEFLNAYEKL